MAFKVFYIDDEPDLLELFIDLFSSKNVEVVTFLDPEAAVRAIWAEPPDLLFVDSRLPKTTGAQVARLIDPAIPKVLITGDLATVPDPNFSIVFSKPLNIPEIAGFIESLRTLRKPEKSC